MDDKFGIGIFIVLIGIMSAQARLSRQLQHQGKLLAKLTAGLNLDLDSLAEPSESVKQLATSPKSYIAAIKAYREQTGAGLVEAKTVIDNVKRDGAVR